MRLSVWLRGSCVVGFSLACYSFLVETKGEVEPDYVPLCDLSPHMSCSKAFLSKYGKGFGFVGQLLGEDSSLNQPNSVPGMIFYTVCFLLSFSNRMGVSKALFYITASSNFMSLYLAYILYFILDDFCVVCVSTYLVNIVLTALSLCKLKRLTSKNDSKSSHLKSS